MKPRTCRFQRRLRRSSGSWVPELEELRLLLKNEAFLEHSPGTPVLDQFGRAVQWMFYSWPVTLSARGAHLAGRCLLEKLQSFDSVQLACYGYTAMPLLSACVLLEAVATAPWCIREERKAHGSVRQIEGSGNRDLPVVVIDDSLSSGNSLRNAVAALEADGYCVEGSLSLVYFPGRGGAEWAQSPATAWISCSMSGRI